MKNFKAKTVLFIAVSVVYLLAANANAGWVDITKDYKDFGHLENTVIDGKGACAATSLINSFKYLENKNPDIYKGAKKLIPDDNLAAARETLHKRIWVPNVVNINQKIWQEKIKWFEERNAPGKFHGMYAWDTKDWYHQTGLTGNTHPTWKFIWDQIAACEDVEIFIWDGKDPNEAHALTLTSLKFNDRNSNGKWDVGEERKIDYLDSNNPTELFVRDLWDDNGRLGFNWFNAGANPSKNMLIYAAFAESVPEPGSLALLTFGSLALLRRRRRLID